MATTVARLEAVLSAKTTEFDRKMAASESRMQKTGKAAGVLGLALAGGLAIGVKHAISDASNLHEQVNKTEVVFRDSGNSVVTWSKHLTTSFGLSSRAALEFAGTFGNMLKPMGISIPLTTKMSKKLVELSGDMASFNNASIDDTLHAIQSGLAGQVRPLRQYGVFLDQNRIKLEALSLGLVHAEVDSAKVRVEQIKLNDAVKAAGEALSKSGKGSAEYVKASANVAYEESKVNKLLEGKVPALTAAQKAQASYSIIVRDTADAHGDFARTSDGLANQQRILKAELENLSATLGTALLPAMENVTAAAIKMTAWFGKHHTATKALVVSLAALSAALLTARAAQLLMNLAVLANPYVAAATAIAVLIGALVVLQVKYNAVSRAVDFLKSHLYLLLAVPVVGEFTAIALAIQPAIVAIHGISSALSHLIGWLRSAVDWVKNLVGWLGKIHVPHLPFVGGGGGGGGGKALTSNDKQMLVNTVPQVKNAVEVARENGWAGSITSGFRTYAQQSALYQRYLAGGPLAAKPGTSSHERGQAVDVSSYGTFGGIMAHTTPAARLYNRLGGADPVHYSVTGYDKGGWLKPGLTMAYNGTGSPERVGGGDVIIPVSIAGEHVATVVFDQLRRKAKVFENRNGRPAFGGA